MKRLSQGIIFLACAFFSIAAVYNVMSDNADVESMALAVACGDAGPNCRMQKTRMVRTPFAQTFEFSTVKRKADVRCTREFVLVGGYTCTGR